MPKKNEHRDVFLCVRTYEKCSSHDHKTIKPAFKSDQHTTCDTLGDHNITNYRKLVIKCPSPREVCGAAPGNSWGHFRDI